MIIITSLKRISNLALYVFCLLYLIACQQNLPAQTNGSVPVYDDNEKNNVEIRNKNVLIPCTAASRSKKGKFYFYWGYNRAFFTKSNIHFSGLDYDVIFYKLKAKDSPTPFSFKNYFAPTKITIPQYNFRLGYFYTNRLSVSFGMDHMKYVVEQGQQALISGVIADGATNKYAGSYLKDPVILTPDLLRFEHTDGLNFLSLDLEYLQPLLEIWKNKISLFYNFGIGGVWIAPRSNVRILGEGLDNDFHIAGYAFALKTGPRLELFKNRFFLSGEIKGAYVSLPSVLIKNAAPDKADHTFMLLEYYITGGVYFKLKNKRKGKQQHQSTR